MEKLTRRVLAHKRAVAIAWLVLTIAGMAAAGPASEALDQKFSVPDKEGWETSQQIANQFGNGGESLPFLAVVTLPEGQGAPDAAEELRGVEKAAAEAVPGSRVAGFGSTGDQTFLSRDGRTAFTYVFPPRSDDPFGGNIDAVRKLETALRDQSVGGAPVKVTGYDALYDSSGEGAEGPGILLEALIGGLGALVVLAFVFG
ncbi:MAG TPA: hypothetical protein VF587_12975, partial [Solirubrobacteraceae bacterium]